MEKVATTRCDEGLGPLGEMHQAALFAAVHALPCVTNCEISGHCDPLNVRFKSIESILEETVGHSTAKGVQGAYQRTREDSSIHLSCCRSIHDNG